MLLVTYTTTELRSTHGRHSSFLFEVDSDQIYLGQDWSKGVNLPLGCRRLNSYQYYEKWFFFAFYQPCERILNSLPAASGVEV